MIDSNTILFSGYARLPSGISSSYIHETMVLVVLIDTRTATIIEAECTLSTRTSERYISGFLIGESINDGVEGINQRIDRYYEGNSKKAISTALRSIYNNYRSYVKSEIYLDSEEASHRE